MRSTHALVCLGTVLLLAAAPAAVGQEPSGPARPAALHVGEPLPDGLSLQSLDGEAYELPVDGVGHPLLLVFFRGTW